MNDPRLYRIGMEGTKFSPQVFWSWILYAFFQGILVINFAFIFNQQPQSTAVHSGLTFQFWSAGMTVYGVCVLLANAVILKMTNNYTGYGELMIIFQCSAFWATVHFETRYPAFRNLFHLWSEFVGSSAAWLGLLMSVLSIFTVDIAVRLIWKMVVSKFKNQKFNFERSLIFENGQSDVKEEIQEVLMQEQF